MIQLPRMRRGTKPYKEAVERTRVLVTERAAYWSKAFGITYRTIAIRKQKTRWGSCSRAGNLNFNYRLGFLPVELADYVVVHELCHVVHHNHGKAFWELLATAYPNWKELRAQLHLYRF